MGIGSFFKKLGKGLLKVAPIATAFIPGVGPIASTLIGAGAGAASGAVSGGKKGALIGGLMGGVSGGVGSAMKGASAATGAAKMGANGVPSLGVTAGLPTGLGASVAAPGIGSQIINAAKGVGGNLLQNMMQPKVLETASRGLGSVAEAEAHNRGVALDAMMDADRNRMQLARDRSAEESDLWKKLQATDYMKSGGTPKPTSPTLSANGKPFTQFSFGPAPISEGNKAMATTLEGQLMNRLNNPMKLSDYESKMEPGKVEKTLNWASPALGIWGEIQKAMQNRPQMRVGGQPTQTPAAGPTPTPQVPSIGVDPLLRMPGEQVRF